MPEEICNGCEWNSGKECTQDPTGSFEPYNNACQRVCELFEDLKYAKAHAQRWKKQWERVCKSVIKLRKENKELKAACDSLDPGYDM